MFEEPRIWNTTWEMVTRILFKQHSLSSGTVCYIIHFIYTMHWQHGMPGRVSEDSASIRYTQERKNKTWRGRCLLKCQQLIWSAFSVTPRIQLPMAESSATQIGNPTQYNFTILANPSPSVTVSWKGKVFEGDDIKVVEEDQGTYMVSLQVRCASQVKPQGWGWGGKIFRWNGFYFLFHTNDNPISLRPV